MKDHLAMRFQEEGRDPSGQGGEESKSLISEVIGDLPLKAGERKIS